MSKDEATRTAMELAKLKAEWASARSDPSVGDFPTERYQRAGLPTDSAARKKIPLATGCLDYFPLALAAVAELSQIGNNKHNPGEPLHWSRGKSNDHPDCLMRHFVDRGKMDGPVRHSTEVAWRALAILQLEIEEASNGV